MTWLPVALTLVRVGMPHILDLVGGRRKTRALLEAVLDAAVAAQETHKGAGKGEAKRRYVESRLGENKAWTSLGKADQDWLLAMAARQVDAPADEEPLEATKRLQYGIEALKANGQRLLAEDIEADYGLALEG